MGGLIPLTGISVLPFGCEPIYPHLPPLAIFCICSRARAPDAPGWVASGTKKPAFAPFRSTLSDTSPVNLTLPSECVSLNRPGFED